MSWGNTFTSRFSLQMRLNQRSIFCLPILVFNKEFVGSFMVLVFCQFVKDVRVFFGGGGGVGAKCPKVPLLIPPPPMLAQGLFGCWHKVSLAVGARSLAVGAWSHWLLAQGL